MNKKFYFSLLFACCINIFSVQTQTITGFRFSSEAIGWNADFVGNINQENQTITFTTQQWIKDIENLSAIFTLDGNYEVKVGETPQLSGVTKNDFRKSIVYTVNDNVHYTVRFVSPQASGVPVIRIDTQEGAPIADRETWISTTFSLTDANNPANNINKTDFRDQIRGRGNSTWGYPKKAYRVRFRDNTSLFGLAAHRNWILLAEFQDPTFLMNVVAFELGGNVFDHQPFTNTYRHVQVYLNGSYNGLYLLTEHRQASPDGIGAPGRAALHPTQGWFVEVDDYWDEDPKFRTTRYNLPIMIGSPEAPTDPANSNNPFYNFIKNDLNQLCDRMSAFSFPENGYRDLIDMDTFIDFIMVNDLVLNGELRHPKSVYCHKGTNGKISMGMLWDFDWGYGYAGGGHVYFNDLTNPSWGTQSMRLPMHDFFRRFFADPVFMEKYRERWDEKFDDIAKIGVFIENIGAQIREAVEEDSKRWAISSGGYWSSYDTDHARQINNMAAWWRRRIEWLDKEYGKIAFVGEGTKENPLQIITAKNIADLAKTINDGNMTPNIHIDVMNDIDLSGYASGAGWTPIGTVDNPFMGVFNGNGRKITGLQINTTGDYSGLFGYIGETAQISNLFVEEANIKGGSYTGGIAGFVNGGKITNCHITGYVNGTDFVGGIAGLISGDGNISYCYAKNAIVGSANIGGIAGTVNSGNITNCVALNPSVRSYGNILKLDRSKWTFPGYDDTTPWAAIGYSSQATNEGASPNGRVIAMLDGNSNTFWHARWSGEPPATDYPHWFIVDLGEIVEFSGIMLQRRHSSTSTSTGFRLYTCVDVPTNQNDPVNGYAWINRGEFSFNPDIVDEQTSWLESSVNARFVKMYFDVHHKGTSNYTMFAEFGLGVHDPSGGRVAGSSAQNSLVNNYAWELIEDVDGENSSWQNNYKNGNDGENISTATANTASFWTNATNWEYAAWNTDVWFIENENLPILKTIIPPEIHAREVTLDKSTLQLTVGESEQLIETIMPENAVNKSVTWSSNNEAVAIVDQSGNVTGVKAGNADITVSTVVNGIYATANITVISDNVSASEEIFANEINIFPNPFTGSLRVVGDWLPSSILKVVNAAGTIVHTQTIHSDEETINVEHLSAGVYLFRFEKNDKTQTLRVVKE